MQRTTRKGFTLVELLVVITIISMLMALLLPAVSGARENARQTQCSNNQKQQTLGLMQVETTRKAFPGYVNSLGIGDPLSQNNPQFLDGSWIVSILPQLERGDLYKLWKEGNSTASSLSVLVCPSNPGAADPGAPMSYAANCGRPDNDYTDTPVYGVLMKNDGALNYKWDGKRWSLRRNTNITSLDYITANDGASNTLLLSENVQANSWAPEKLASPPQSAGEYEANLGIVWDLNNQVAINQGLNTTGLYAVRPSSKHPGIVIVSFCDGRQRSVRDDVDYAVYMHLMTPNSQKAGITATYGPFDEGKL